MTPAMRPITAAAQGCTNAHGAVIATRPASMPLAIIPGSGLSLDAHCTQNIATTAPNAPAIAVLTATTANRLSVAESVDAALKPNHPNSRMNVPSIAIGMWCAASTRGLPSGPYFPIRGPRIERAGEAGDTAHHVHDTGTGEVGVAVAHVRGLSPSLASQPPPHVHAPNSG